MKLYHKLYLAAVIVLVLIIWNANSQSGVGDLIGGFEEVAMYRNENNTGPIERVYIVSIKDTLLAEMMEYGNYMPFTKYGSTKVYFFYAGNPMPSIAMGGEVNYPVEFDPYCLAKFEKSGTVLAKLRRY
jgi:hypothetical protein